jgi:hypothetical protein
MSHAEETIATTAMAVGAAFGMHDELLRLMGLMQRSRTGIEAYLNHRTEVIMLAGLPDVAESRPHARFNSR